MAFFYYHGLRDEKEKKGVLSKQQKWSIVRQSFLTSFLILIILIVLLVVYSYFGLGGQEELVVSILA
ncbi:MAG: hypothetical protein EP332_10975 [Bacteroidetes bacterium]|nr:MAG: hypothetical protein EP332_10975 [Bacteroidota bacterium]